MQTYKGIVVLNFSGLRIILLYISNLCHVSLEIYFRVKTAPASKNWRFEGAGRCMQPYSDRFNQPPVNRRVWKKRKQKASQS